MSPHELNGFYFYILQGQSEIGGGGVKRGHEETATTTIHAKHVLMVL